jgi:hypothetical protein
MTSAQIDRIGSSIISVERIWQLKDDCCSICLDGFD